MSSYAQMLAEPLDPEAFVRRALAALECEFREFALVALAAWQQANIPAPELFRSVAALQRPSWGSWNGLLLDLGRARRQALRTADADRRARLVAGADLSRVLEVYDGPVPEALVERLRPLAGLLGVRLGKRSRYCEVLALPIALRNRVVHDGPNDPDWWQEAAAGLRPLVEHHGTAAVVAAALSAARRPAPWFLQVEGKRWHFCGVQRDNAVLYSSAQGETRGEGPKSRDVFLAFQRLLGKFDATESDLRKLLSKLAPDDVKGVVMGDYLVGRPVGEGGFALVHVGTQISTGRKVAIKILRDGLPEEARQRFLQEATFLSRFDHPNIVGVVGRGEEPWRAPRAFSLTGEPWFERFSKSAPIKSFLVLEWVDGKTLDEIFHLPEDERPDWRTLLGWFADAAQAVAAVHGVGLIHRDVKPANLMVNSNGVIKLMDFGIARSQHDDRTLMTRQGTVGTPAYMSPEQIRTTDSDSEVGPASDIYSLCATFYELFTNERLFGHDATAAETVKTMKLQGAKPTRPRLLRKALPWEVDAVLLGGLEPEVVDRYHTMLALERDARRVLADEPILYKRPSWRRRLQLGYRRNRLVVNLLTTFAALAVAGVAQYVVAIRAEQERTAKERGDALLDLAERELSDDLSRAKDRFTDALRSAVDAAAANPDDPVWLRQRSIAHDGLARVAAEGARAKAQGERAELVRLALVQAQNAVQAAEQIGAGPEALGEVTRLTRLGEAHRLLGRLHQEFSSGDDVARQLLRSARQVLAAVPRSGETTDSMGLDEERWVGLVRVTQDLADLERGAGHLQEARSLYLEAARLVSTRLEGKTERPSQTALKLAHGVASGRAYTLLVAAKLDRTAMRWREAVLTAHEATRCLDSQHDLATCRDPGCSMPVDDQDNLAELYLVAALAMQDGAMSEPAVRPALVEAQRWSELYLETARCVLQGDNLKQARQRLQRVQAMLDNVGVSDLGGGRP